MEIVHLLKKLWNYKGKKCFKCSFRIGALFLFIFVLFVQFFVDTHRIFFDKAFRYCPFNQPKTSINSSVRYFQNILSCEVLICEYC